MKKTQQEGSRDKYGYLEAFVYCLQRCVYTIFKKQYVT